MPGTDFFDDDLVRKRDGAQRVSMGPGDQPVGTLGPPPPSAEMLSRPVSDLNLTRMARHKESVDENVAMAVTELERLKQRQEDLEREKKELEDLRDKQVNYQQGRKDMMARLRESIVTLEKDEIKADTYTQLLVSTRRNFKVRLDDIDALNEDAWDEGEIREELNNAITIIDSSRVEYNKALTRIEAARHVDTDDERPPPVFHEQERVQRQDVDRPFGYWIKIGFAASLPLIITLMTLMAIFLFLRSSALI